MNPIMPAYSTCIPSFSHSLIPYYLYILLNVLFDHLFSFGWAYFPLTEMVDERSTKISSQNRFLYGKRPLSRLVSGARHNLSISPITEHRLSMCDSDRFWD